MKQFLAQVNLLEGESWTQHKSLGTVGRPVSLYAGKGRLATWVLQGRPARTDGTSCAQFHRTLLLWLRGWLERCALLNLQAHICRHSLSHYRCRVALNIA